MPSLLDIIGGLGSILLILSSVPQVIHTVKTKNVEGLSLGTLLFWFLGVLLMGIYVLYTTCQMPLLLNYGFNTLIVGLNLGLYFKYR